MLLRSLHTAHLMSAKANTYYAVRNGRRPGIYSTWEDCEPEVRGFSGAEFKKFKTNTEAVAFVDGRGNLTSKGIIKPRKRSSKSPSPRLRSQSPKSSQLYTVTPTSITSTTTTITTTTATESLEHITVWTDGACKDNGNDSARAGIGVFFGHNNFQNISERLKGRQTNQRAELTAAFRGIQEAIKMKGTNIHLEIKTDSIYAVKGMTEWIIKWKAKNWSQNLTNMDLWKQLDEISQNVKKITWTHVPAHVGIIENEEADKLAGRGCDLPEI